jgi:hypothetical protein
VAPVSRSKLLLIDENLFFQIGVIDEIDVFVEDAKVRDWPIAAGGVAQERKRMRSLLRPKKTKTWRPRGPGGTFMIVLSRESRKKTGARQGHTLNDG